MKTAYFDQNFRLDDPNLYFGDPPRQTEVENIQTILMDLRDVLKH